MNIIFVIFSVGNVFKCVVVIVVFVIYFRNLVLFLNVVGFVLVLFGAYLYIKVFELKKFVAVFIVMMKVD